MFHPVEGLYCDLGCDLNLGANENLYPGGDWNDSGGSHVGGGSHAASGSYAGEVLDVGGDVLADVGFGGVGSSEGVEFSLALGRNLALTESKNSTPLNRIQAAAPTYLSLGTVPLYSDTHSAPT